MSDYPFAVKTSDPDLIYEIVGHQGTEYMQVVFNNDADRTTSVRYIPIEDIEKAIRRHREEQTTVDEPTTEPVQATDTPLLQRISERAQQGLDQGVILAREAYAALRDIIELCKEEQ